MSASRFPMRGGEAGLAVEHDRAGGERSERKSFFALSDCPVRPVGIRSLLRRQSNGWPNGAAAGQSARRQMRSLRAESSRGTACRSIGRRVPPR